MDKIGHNRNVRSRKPGFCSHITFDSSPTCSRLYYLLFQNSVNQHFPKLVIQEKQENRKGNAT